jgi:hypothetical protein
MRRVLEKGVQGLLDERGIATGGNKLLTGYQDLSAAEGEKKEQRGFISSGSFLFGAVGGSYWYTRFNTRGLYVPGSGAVFSLEVTVPAHSVPIDREKEGEGDVWDQTEKELKQGFSLDRMKKEKDRKWVIDEAAVDAVIERLVETAARHGRNIEHLADSDRITLIVTFKGGTALQKAAEYTGDAALAQAYSLVATANLSEDVIIQVPMSSLLASQRQGGDNSAVKRAARILRFKEKGEEGDAKKAW